MRKAVLFAVLALPCSLSGQQQDPFIQTIEKVKLSIVPVACGTWPNSKDEVSINEIEGTGFFINYEGDFVAAAHVIKDHFKWNKLGQPDPNCYPVIYVPAPTWESRRWFQFQLCTLDEIIDVAVCKMRVNPFAVPGLRLSRLHLVSTVPVDGTSVAFTGFPQLILVPITSRANVASAGIFLKPGQLDIVIDKTTWHGVSGGPLYLADGTVIGIIYQTGQNLWSGMAFARQTSAVLKFLSDHKIPMWQAEQEKHNK